MSRQDTRVTAEAAPFPLASAPFPVAAVFAAPPHTRPSRLTSFIAEQITSARILDSLLHLPPTLCICGAWPAVAIAEKVSVGYTYGKPCFGLWGSGGKRSKQIPQQARNALYLRSWGCLRGVCEHPAILPRLLVMGKAFSSANLPALLAMFSNSLGPTACPVLYALGHSRQ